MNRISFGDLRKVLREEKLEGFEARLPIQITVNEQPAFIIERIENIISLSDIHPAMRIKLKAMERIARPYGPTKIDTDEFKVA